jgi:hypothetical protein
MMEMSASTCWKWSYSLGSLWRISSSSAFISTCRAHAALVLPGLLSLRS